MNNDQKQGPVGELRKLPPKVLGRVLEPIPEGKAQQKEGGKQRGEGKALAHGVRLRQR
jgi:hypothetical protein